jgi:predicted nuclease of predicted toxin-antitoxin system
MKFLIDQNLPDALARWLIDQGHEAEHVRLLGLAEAADGVILRRTVDLHAVLISKDADFAGARSAGLQLVWVRLGNTTNDRLLAVWSAAWPEMVAALQEGERIVELRPF